MKGRLRTDEWRILNAALNSAHMKHAIDPAHMKCAAKHHEMCDEFRSTSSSSIPHAKSMRRNIVTTDHSGV
jgi:hypothetical protein